MKLIGKYKIISFLSALLFLVNFKVAKAIWPFTADALADAMWTIPAFIGNLLLSVSSKILGLAGSFFNTTLIYTLEFKDLVASTGVVNIGWEIFRDLSNMFFIFILLIISIATILGLSYNAKALLSKVILVALLINFSLFTANVVIDSSNVLAIGFYNATIAGAGGSDPDDKGISGIFSQALRLGTLYDHEDLKPDENGVKLTHRKIFVIGVFGSLFLLVTAFVFFAAAILFIVRIVVLMFVMMTAPIAFLGMILPATRGFSKEWWTMLFSQSFFAPVYLAFIYIVASGINSSAFQETLKGSADNSFASAITGGETQIIVSFALITGLMLASLISAKKIGAYGATTAISMGKDVQKWGQGKVGGATFGAAGRFGRSTLGRGFNKIADSNRMKNWAAKGSGTSKLALKTLRGVGDSSFDARNTAVGKKMQMGSGIKGGYATHRKEIEKEKITYGKSLKGNTGKMVATGRVNPVTGAPIMRAVSRTEAYGQAVQDRSIMSTLTGTTAANKKAGKNLVNEFTYKRDLADAKKVLKRLSDELTDLRKTGSGATPLQISNKRDEIGDADDKVEEIKEKIKKLTEDKK